MKRSLFLILLVLSILWCEARSQMLAPTQQLDRAVVRGELTLDAADDGVFDQLYDLLNRGGQAHPLYVDNELWRVETKFFLAWASAPEALQNAKEPTRNILKFRDASVKDILAAVAKARGLKVVDMAAGWLFVFPETRIVERDAVITEEEAEKNLTLFLGPPQRVEFEITNATPADLLRIMNASLQPKDKTKKGAFEIKGLPENGSVNQHAEKTLLSFRGVYNYVHLLHIRGMALRSEFRWANPDVLQEHRTSETGK